MRKGTAVCPLRNSPLASASSVDNTKCFKILHSIWIGPFTGGGRFEDFPGRIVAISGNISLQCVCVTVVLIVRINHCQCEVSYC